MATLSKNVLFLALMSYVKSADVALVEARDNVGLIQNKLDSFVFAGMGEPNVNSKLNFGRTACFGQVGFLMDNKKIKSFYRNSGQDYNDFDRYT